MNCRRSVRLLPLAAGGDLKPGQARRLEAHLGKCPACRAELASLRTALEEIRAAARRVTSPEWTEGEWRSVMAAVLSRASDRRRIPPFRRPVWILGGTAVLALTAGLLWRVIHQAPPTHSPLPPSPRDRTVVSHPPPEPGPADFRPAPPVERESPRTAVASASLPPRVRELVFVSSESGLTIHWVLNSEFEWKENVR